MTVIQNPMQALYIRGHHPLLERPQAAEAVASAQNLLAGLAVDAGAKVARDTSKGSIVRTGGEPGRHGALWATPPVGLLRSRGRSGGLWGGSTAICAVHERSARGVQASTVPVTHG